MPIRINSQVFSGTALAGASSVTFDEVSIDDTFDRLTLVSKSSLLNGVLELQTKLGNSWVTVVTINLTANTVDISTVYHFFPLVRIVFTPAVGVTTDLDVQLNVVRHVAQ